MGRPIPWLQSSESERARWFRSTTGDCDDVGSAQARRQQKSLSRVNGARTPQNQAFTDPRTRRYCVRTTCLFVRRAGREPPTSAPGGGHAEDRKERLAEIETPHGRMGGVRHPSRNNMAHSRRWSCSWTSGDCARTCSISPAASRRSGIDGRVLLYRIFPAIDVRSAPSISPRGAITSASATSGGARSSCRGTDRARAPSTGSRDRPRT
jgi:hypothetical protein